MWSSHFCFYIKIRSFAIPLNVNSTYKRIHIRFTVEYMMSSNTKIFIKNVNSWVGFFFLRCRHRHYVVNGHLASYLCVCVCHDFSSKTHKMHNATAKIQCIADSLSVKNRFDGCNNSFRRFCYCSVHINICIHIKSFNPD